MLRQTEYSRPKFSRHKQSLVTWYITAVKSVVDGRMLYLAHCVTIGHVCGNVFCGGWQSQA